MTERKKDQEPEGVTVEEQDKTLGGDSEELGQEKSGVSRPEQDRGEDGSGLSGDTESDSPPAPSTR